MNDELGPKIDSRRNAWFAAALSFILPGAGLAYLGKWGAAAINLLVAIILPAISLLAAPPEVTDHIHYLYLVIAVGSGAWGHAAAKQSDGTTRQPH